MQGHFWRVKSFVPDTFILIFGGAIYLHQKKNSFNINICMGQPEQNLHEFTH